MKIRGTGATLCRRIFKQVAKNIRIGAFLEVVWVYRSVCLGYELRWNTVVELRWNTVVKLKRVNFIGVSVHRSFL